MFYFIESLGSGTDSSPGTITPPSQQSSASQGSITNFLTRLKPSQPASKVGATPTKTSHNTCTGGLVFEPVSLLQTGQSFSKDVVDVEDFSAKGDNQQSKSCFPFAKGGNLQVNRSHFLTKGDSLQSNASLFSTNCISDLETDSETKINTTKSDSKSCSDTEELSAREESQVELNVTKGLLLNESTNLFPLSTNDSFEGMNDQPFKIDSVSWEIIF